VIPSSEADGPSGPADEDPVQPAAQASALAPELALADDLAPRAQPALVVDKRNFASGHCVCGWRGPGRRSRERARDDEIAHLAEGCSANPM